MSLAVEVAVRAGFDRVSKIQRRIASEYRLATMIGRSPCTGHRHVLLIGNSLLYADIQFDRLRDAIGTECDVRRFVIEQTGYMDWYYGLRRLFHNGARPDVVVLVLTARQSIGSSIRGDYSAEYLIDKNDLPSAVRDLRLNPTEATDLLFAGVSKFWATRAEIRNFVLGHLMPDLGGLMQFSGAVNPTPLVDDEVEHIMYARLARLKAISDAYGAKLVIVVPPIHEERDGAAGFLRAGSAAGVAMVRPVPSGSLPSRSFLPDRFHLSEIGAAEFTGRLIPLLREQLERRGVRRSPATTAAVQSSRASL